MKIFHWKKLFTVQAVSCAVLLATSGASAQVAPPVMPKVASVPPSASPSGSGEKFLPTAENVSVQMCVRDGGVRVTGWTRNEVRVLVKDSATSFAVRTLRSDEQRSPVWVAVEAIDSTNGECLSGNIEINLPKNGSFNLKSDSAADLFAENVRKLNATLYSGDVFVREIGREAEISTLSGDVSINESQGKFVIGSMSGDIVARRLAPLEVSDILRVKSQSGDVTLFETDYNNIAASTNLGTIVFNGNPLNNSTYDFRTNIGDIRLLVPSKANFTLSLLSVEQKITSPLRYNIEDCKCSKNTKHFIFGTEQVNSNFNLNVYDGRITVQPSDSPEKK